MQAASEDTLAEIRKKGQVIFTRTELFCFEQFWVDRLDMVMIGR
jgi:hypothetical protein